MAVCWATPIEEQLAAAHARHRPLDIVTLLEMMKSSASAIDYSIEARFGATDSELNFDSFVEALKQAEANPAHGLQVCITHSGDPASVAFDVIVDKSRRHYFVEAGGSATRNVFPVHARQAKLMPRRTGTFAAVDFSYSNIS